MGAFRLVNSWNNMAFIDLDIATIHMMKPYFEIAMFNRKIQVKKLWLEIT